MLVARKGHGPNPDEPELKIEDCKLNIYGCRSPRRRRYNPYEPEASLRAFLKWIRLGGQKIITKALNFFWNRTLKNWPLRGSKDAAI